MHSDVMNLDEDFQYVRNTYGVPAALGCRVIVNGKPGIIAADRGQYIGVNFDADKPGTISHCHPTWMVDYGKMGTIRKVKMTRGQARYQEYLHSIYYESGHSFAFFLGIQSAKA